MTARIHVRLWSVDEDSFECTSDIAFALCVGWFGVRDDCRVVRFGIRYPWSWLIILRSLLRISFLETILSVRYR